MIEELTIEQYYTIFPRAPHCFLERSFIELNTHKVDRVIFLAATTSHIGLVAGITHDAVKSPFSAPLGGFHINHDLLTPEDITHFLNDIKTYLQNLCMKSISITVPPEFLAPTMNGKSIISFLQSGFSLEIPEICNSFDFKRYTGLYESRFIGKNIRHAQREGLLFAETTDYHEMRDCYTIIAENRVHRGRAIHISFEDLLQTAKILPIRFFKITDPSLEIVAAAIIYYSGNRFIHVVFWADSEKGRPLRAMNFLVDNLWQLHQDEGFDYADIGTSSLDGIPNAGVIHFKESHGCTTSPRFSFTTTL